MGSIIGCANNICFQKSTKRTSIDILNLNNLENLYIVNSTGKNEQTKPALLVKEKEIDEIKPINNEKEYKEKEEEKEEEEKEKEDEKENVEKEEKVSSYSSESKSEEENNIKENGKVLSKKEKNGNKKEMENGKDSLSFYNIYEKNIDKIKLIQRKYREHKETIKNKNTKKIIKENKKKEFNLSRDTTINNIKLSLSSKNIKGDNKIQKIGGKNETEEIISIGDSYIYHKKSSKVVNNTKNMDFLKNSMILSNNKTNLFKMHPEIKNYFNLLDDFGQKLSLIKPSNNISKKFKLTHISLSKNKRGLLSKKTKDNIKGNFIQKNEKVIRYQGGFLKKTRKKNGFGIITWSDNSKLKGIFESNELNGICRFYNYKYKSTFIGEYLNNQPKGFGVYSVKSFSLQGYWESDNLNGIAIEVWEDGTYFQGEYKDNKKNGVGLYRWPDGTIYQGEFRDGQMNGQGIILYSNDCIFSGEIENGYMNGFGNFSWGNGSMYIGYYSQDIKNGFGIYIWDEKNFVCYIGFWEMGKQQGIGAKVNGNKIKYSIWNKGKISVTLKGLYEIDKYLTGTQKGYYQYFTPAYISKLKLTNFFNLNEK